MDVAVDLTVRHGWQASERSSPSRARWRSFLCRKDWDKHSKYDAVCATVGWAFQASAFGTWGGMGPEAAKLLARLCKRADSWHAGSSLGAPAAEGRQSIGVALMRQVWRLLAARNFVR